MKKILFLILAFWANLLFAQETNRISDFNGIWVADDDSLCYLIFKDGKQIDPYFLDRTISIDYYIYGFCPDSLKYGNNLLVSKTTIKNQSDLTSRLFCKYEIKEQNNRAVYITTYEFELGNNALILFYSKDLHYTKIKKLPPKLEKRLRIECKKKNIDIDYFIGIKPLKK